MALFLISQAIFPTAFFLYGVQTNSRCPCLQSLKKSPVIRWVEEASSPNLRHRGGHRFVSPPEEEDFDLTSAMRGAETSHSSIREPRSTNMDYPPSLGKHFACYFSM